MVAKAQVTAKDVARAAGVSQATVSYVLNNTPDQKISPATRERVLAAVAELGYAPSAAARALRRGSSDLVLLAHPDVPLGPVLAGFIETLTDRLDEQGLTLLSRRLTPQRALGTLWRELRPAAVVTMADPSESEQREMTAHGVRHVGLALSPTPGSSRASISQGLIGRRQAEHLASAGHRRLAYAGPDEARLAYLYARRLDGLRTTCRELGLDDVLVEPVPLDDVATEAVVRRWRADGVTAVAAYNDEVAFAVLAGMHRAGWSAPGDLAVIGVDNIALARLASPPLTTVDQNFDLVAEHVARRVIAEVRAGPQPGPLPSDAVTVVVRRSA